MAKIVVECADPNDLDAVESAAEKFVGKCNVTYFKTHQALKEAGTSESVRQSARIISEDTGESEGAARMRINRGQAEVERLVPRKSETPAHSLSPTDDYQEPEEYRTPAAAPTPPEPTFKSGRGGHREGSGRKTIRSLQERLDAKGKSLDKAKAKIVSEEFKATFNAFFITVKNEKHFKWSRTSQEAAIEHIKILFDTITIS